jgi:thiol-disulfide isomerase/thioredoxin
MVIMRAYQHKHEYGFALAHMLIILAVIAFLGGGAYYFVAPADENKNSVICSLEAKLCPDGTSVGRAGPNCEFSECPSETVTESDIKDDAVAYSGSLLAGDKDGSPLLEFNQTDYDNAISSGKLVVLYFYANWCPICKEEFPRMEAAFDSLNDPSVVGFRVSYKDSETTKDEEEVAREHGVAYQHTKVFVHEGNRIKKSPEGYPTMEHYVSTIKQVLEQL